MIGDWILVAAQTNREVDKRRKEGDEGGLNSRYTLLDLITGKEMDFHVSDMQFLMTRNKGTRKYFGYLKVTGFENIIIKKIGTAQSIHLLSKRFPGGFKRMTHHHGD